VTEYQYRAFTVHSLRVEWTAVRVRLEDDPLFSSFKVLSLISLQIEAKLRISCHVGDFAVGTLYLEY
jgi:hypothetical protein